MAHPDEGAPEPQRLAGSRFRHELILEGDGGEGFVSQSGPMINEPARAGRQVLVAAATERPQSGEAPLLPFDGRLAPAPADAREIVFDEGGLAGLRRAVTAWAGACRLPPESIEELVLAVDEIATNSIRYGGGEGTLRMWEEPGTLLCEVADRGQMKDPLLGRLQPGHDALSGRGLWIVNHLCDLVQICSSARGSRVRLHKLLA